MYYKDKYKKIGNKYYKIMVKNMKNMKNKKQYKQIIYKIFKKDLIMLKKIYNSQIIKN